jgi:hypothetical protein
MNKIGYTTCLLGKIANDVEDLERYWESEIHQLKNYSISPLNSPDKHLFASGSNKRKGANGDRLTSSQRLRTMNESEFEEWCNGGKGNRLITSKRPRTMSESEFEEWCIRGESKLHRYKLAELIETWSIFIFFIILLGLPVVLNKILSVFFMISVDIAALLLVAIVIATLSLLISLKFATFPMNKIEYISCLLGKIANDIKDLDESSMESDIKQLKKHTMFPLRFPDKHLFVEDITKQKDFYNLLKGLHRRLLYRLRTGSLEEVKPEDIKKLAYYIHEDSEEKVDVLQKIIEDNPEELPPPLKPIMRGIIVQEYSKVSLVTLLLVLFSYFVLFKYIGLEINTVAIISTIVWVFVNGIIYVQKMIR